LWLAPMTTTRCVFWLMLDGCVGVLRILKQNAPATGAAIREHWTDKDQSGRTAL